MIHENLVSPVADDDALDGLHFDDSTAKITVFQTMSVSVSMAEPSVNRALALDKGGDNW